MKSINGHNYVKTEGRVMVLFSAHPLIIPYNSTKVHDENLNGFEVIEGTRNITRNKQRGIITSEMKVG